MKSNWHLGTVAILACALHAQSPTAPDSTAKSPSTASVPAAAGDSTRAKPSLPASRDTAAPAMTAPAPAKAASPAPDPAPAAAPPKASPAPARAAAAKSEPSAPSKPEAKPAGGSATTARGGESEGFAFHPGASFGVVTMNGQTWTRLSFNPEVSFGKLGVGFNIELFLDQNQNLSSRGWDFDTRRNGTESVLRKIDYVRWDHPGAPFYARVGTLEGISMGYGLVASGYGNKARYPDYKELGVDIQLNDMTGLGLDVEGIVGNMEDLGNKGPFTAAKAGLRPLKPLGLPLLQDLAVRVGAAYDWNQYASLRDQDADGCPDALDYAPTNSSVCVQPIDIRDLPGLDTAKSTGYSLQRADSADKANADATRAKYATRKPFAVYWLEAAMPIITTEFLGLELHSAFAAPRTQDPEAVEAGWGAIPLGAGAHVGPVTLTAEYRLYSLPFQPDYFNEMYSIERARFVGKQVVTKEMEVYGPGAQWGTVQGYFAGAGWDAFGIAKLSGTYSHMFPSRSGDDEIRALSGSLGIGPTVTSLLQEKVSLAEVYWKKDRIELDKYAAAGAERHDSFFGNSSYTVFGYRVGSLVAPGLTMILDRQTSFTRQTDGRLKRENQMRIEAQMKF